jgi:hypothetical protein
MITLAITSCLTGILDALSHAPPFFSKSFADCCSRVPDPNSGDQGEINLKTGKPWVRVLLSEQTKEPKPESAIVPIPKEIMEKVSSFRNPTEEDQTNLLAPYRASQSGEIRERKALEHAEEIIPPEYQ